MKKIGILTFHTPYNFGANLQAYASSHYLMKLGYDVKVINYIRESSYRDFVPKEQWSAHDDFISKRLPLTRPAHNEQELIEIVKEEKFDGVIVGADAIWSYRNPESNIPVYFMKWLFDTPEISHIPVASMSPAHMGKGFKRLSSQKRNAIRDALSKFKYITVRDKWTQHVINRDFFAGEKYIKNISVDPVFIFDEIIEDEFDRKGLITEYDRYIIISFPKSSAYLAPWLKEFRKVANDSGCLVGELPLPDGVSGLEFDFTVPYPIDPIQWYLWLSNAVGFIGLRFHAVVSCINAQTPFFSIDSYGKKHKYYSALLNRLKCPVLAAALDSNSKIYNLLNGSGYERNRVQLSGFWRGVKPEKLLQCLLGCNSTMLNELKNNNSIMFNKYLMDITRHLQ